MTQQEPTTGIKAHVPLDDDRYARILAALGEKQGQLRGLLTPLHPADIADILERLPRNQREELLPFIPEELIGDVLSELEEGVRDFVLHALEPSQVAAAVEEMDSDDAVDIVQQLADGETFADIQLITDKQHKRLLQYDPYTAGGLMQYELITALPDQTVSQVLAFMRKSMDTLPNNPGTIFVINEKRKLLGTISIPQLVQCTLQSKLSDVMRENPLSLQVDQDENEVISFFEKYDIHNCAVVNKRGQLLGRISVDDVLDVVLEQQARISKRAAGISESEDLFAPITEITRHRLPWLVVNLFTAILASIVIANFEGTISQLVTLAILMPIVASMGGNAGTQTLTVIVRGLATGQITRQNATLLLWRELTIGTLNGILLGILLAVGTLLLYQNMMLSAIILGATIANHVFAAIAGHLIPLLLKRLKYDPAISSGVLVTTVTDVGGFFVFLGLAAALL